MLCVQLFVYYRGTVTRNKWRRMLSEWVQLLLTAVYALQTQEKSICCAQLWRRLCSRTERMQTADDGTHRYAASMHLCLIQRKVEEILFSVLILC